MKRALLLGAVVICVIGSSRVFASERSGKSAPGVRDHRHPVLTPVETSPIVKPPVKVDRPPYNFGEHCNDWLVPYWLRFLKNDLL